MKISNISHRVIFQFIWLISMFSIIVKADLEDYKELNAELDSFLSGWTEAYNKRDINALINKYDEKADVIYFDGVQRNGREGIKLYFEEQFCQYKDVTEIITDVNRNFLSPSIVIETGVWHRSGNSDPLAPTIGRYSCTLIKINGSWKIIHDRGWALKDNDSDGSKLKSKDKLSKLAEIYLTGSIKGDLEVIEPLLHAEVVVFVNDLKVTGKESYLTRWREIHKSIERGEINDGHFHTNYFSKSGNAFNGLSWGEVRGTPSVWSNCWATLSAKGKSDGNGISFRIHADMRWENEKIVELLFYYDPKQLSKEMGF